MTRRVAAARFETSRNNGGFPNNFATAKIGAAARRQRYSGALIRPAGRGGLSAHPQATASVRTATRQAGIEPLQGWQA